MQNWYPNTLGKKIDSIRPSVSPDVLLAADVLYFTQGAISTYTHEHNLGGQPCK